MFARVAQLLLLATLLCGTKVQGKGADGLVILKGTVQHAIASAEGVSFEFTGSFSFKFFTATLETAGSKQLDLDFQVQGLRIVVPTFGERLPPNSDPYVVSFENAVRHALAASKSGEDVTVVLFSPTLSFNINGVIEGATCTHAQVLPARLERRLSQ
jgi:hypothetical protein